MDIIWLISSDRSAVAGIGFGVNDGFDSGMEIMYGD